MMVMMIIMMMVVMMMMMVTTVMVMMMMMMVTTVMVMMMMTAITMMAVVMTMIMVMFLHSSMRKGGSKNLSYIMETFHELDINSEYICIYVSGLLSRHGPAVCYKHVHGQFFFPGAHKQMSTKDSPW